MKAQVMNLGTVVVRYELGETWFEGTLELSGGDDGAERSFRVAGTDAVVALRDFLNSLDFAGRKLAVVKGG